MKQLWFSAYPTFLLLWFSSTPLAAQYLSHQDITARPTSTSGERISYGSDSLQFGELRMPEGKGPHPVATVIHGGCWLSMADLRIMDHFCSELTEAGIATWNLEYRRVDSPGGGWPNTFKDIGKGIDHIRKLANESKLDLKRVVIVGHSAGGHLALWAAARHRLDKNSELYTEKPFKPVGVVSLAGPPDLHAIEELAQTVCGSDVIRALLGGSPDEVPDRYRDTSPSALLPTSIRQIVIYGSDDPAVPPELGLAYVHAGKQRGENIGFVIIPAASHFELIAPWTSSWFIVKAAIESLLISERAVP